MKKGLRAARQFMVINALLAVGKIVAGFLGHSYALVADGVESTLDIASSFIVWIGLRVSRRPADDNHPYGHGKAESLAALAVSLMLVLAAAGLAVQSVREILHPHTAPAPFTLWVLLAVIVIKELLFRRAGRIGEELHSSSLKADAWHHRSDALTSAAAFLGIGIALLGGEGFEAADDWAALFACGIILWNGLRLLRWPLDEVMDASASEEVVGAVRRLAETPNGVDYVEKCRVRKSGTGYLVDIHISVDGDLPVARGHEISHEVKDLLMGSTMGIIDVIVHIEPSDGG